MVKTAVLVRESNRPEEDNSGPINCRKQNSGDNVCSEFFPQVGMHQVQFSLLSLLNFQHIGCELPLRPGADPEEFLAVRFSHLNREQHLFCICWRREILCKPQLLNIRKAISGHVRGEESPWGL